MGMGLDSADEDISFPPIDSIPDGPEDKPTPGPLLEEKIESFDLPELIFGAAAWSSFYTEESNLSTDVPLRTIRLALRYGIRAFDTAPLYDNSETVLGTALQALSHEFPRSAYQLLTKVGRYGPTAADFDYSRDAVRRSVRRSLRRMHTQYLDVVYVHDIEFVASCVTPRAQGNHAPALGAEAAAYGLVDEKEVCESDASGERAGSREGAQGNVRTAGDDERVLEAISALRELQAEGLIRHVGISGPSSFPLFPHHFPHSHLTPLHKTHRGRPRPNRKNTDLGLPLPALLRTALLVLGRTGRPIDAVQTYAHLTLQNATLLPFATALRTRARVALVTAASPLGMGLLVPPPRVPPAWHPAPDAVRTAATEAARSVAEAQKGNDDDVAAVAIAWSVRAALFGDVALTSGRMPVVIGMSNLREAHAAVGAWRWARDEGRVEELEHKAALAQAVFERTDTAGWTWSSGNWV